MLTRSIILRRLLRRCGCSVEAVLEIFECIFVSNAVAIPGELTHDILACRLSLNFLLNFFSDFVLVALELPAAVTSATFFLAFVIANRRRCRCGRIYCHFFLESKFHVSLHRRPLFLPGIGESP